MAKRPRGSTQSVVTKPVRELPPGAEAWIEKDSYGGWSIQHGSTSLWEFVRMIREGVFLVPIFQREYVWTDANILLLLDSIHQGYLCGPLLLWELDNVKIDSVIAGLRFPDRVGGLGRRALVIDGQQRIGAIARAVTGRFGFNFARREFCVDEPESPDVILLTTFFNDDVLARYEWGDKSEVGHYKVRYLDRRISYYQMSSVRLPMHMPVERVVESYRRIATLGVPMDPVDVADGVKRWLESTQSGFAGASKVKVKDLAVHYARR